MKNKLNIKDYASACKVTKQRIRNLIKEGIIVASPATEIMIDINKYPIELFAKKNQTQGNYKK